MEQTNPCVPKQKNPIVQEQTNPALSEQPKKANWKLIVLLQLAILLFACCTLLMKLAAQHPMGQAGHFDVQIDAIDQRPRNPRPIAAHLLLAAGAAPFGVPQVTAGTWVHRRHQLESRREIRLAGGAGNGDSA